VFRDRWATGRKIGGDLADSLPAVTQQGQDFSAGWIGNRPEDCIPLLAFYRNHMVTNTVTNRLR
jgi:hypothetical protein